MGDSLGGIVIPRGIVMLTRQLSIAVLLLPCAARLAAAQHSAAPDSEFAQVAGHWVAADVSFQSGNSAHPFAIDVKRVGDKIQVTLPAELKLEAGSVYVLARAGVGVFRHVDNAGRIVELSLTSPAHATLLITGGGGDGRITWQLRR